MANKINFKFRSPQDSPGYLLSQLSLQWYRKQKKILDPLDLTHTQFTLLAALAWLSKSSENVTQVDISNQSNADRMMVSKVLRTLEKKEFITRNEHVHDTRAKIVTLTSTGARVLQQALAEVETTDMEFFAELGSSLPAFNANMWKLIVESKNK